MKKKVKKSGKSKSAIIKPKSIFARKEKYPHICDPSRCHNVDFNNYYFYQTPQTLKISVTIPGVENLPKSKIKARFQEKSFQLSVYDLINSNYHLIFDNLLYCIIPNKCKYFIRKDKIILELFKQSSRIWKSLEEIVSKGEWIQTYCEFLEDIPDFGDADSLFCFAEGMWDQLNKLQDTDFNYLKPPGRMHELIPSLRKHPAFKTLDEAASFYKSQLKKDCFNESLYIILGGTLLEKQKEDKLAQIIPKSPEVIEDSIFKAKNIFVNPDKESGSTSDFPEENNDKEVLAEAKKSEGNSYYKTGKFYAALQMYLDAIKLWPENPYLYSNSSASYMMLGLYSDALAMAQKAVKADDTFVRGFLRIGKCNLALGNTKAALKAFNRVRELEPENTEVEMEFCRLNKLQESLRDGKNAAHSKTYTLAASYYETACDIAVASSSIMFLRVENLILSDRFPKVKSIANNLLEQNMENADAHYLLGLVAYHQDGQTEAFREFEEALRISKNHTKTKTIMETARKLYGWKDLGNVAFRLRNFEEALSLYTSGLEVDPKNKVVNAKLHYNIASAKLQLNKVEEAIESLTSAIEVKNDYVKAYLRRARLYEDINEPQKAIQDLKKAVRISPTEGNKILLKDAQSQQEMCSRKDYYDILNVPPCATTEEITNAYKKLSLLHQPDKHEDKQRRQKEERLIKDISEAYNVLRDPQKRYVYDHTEPDDCIDDYDLEERDLFKLFLLTQLMRPESRNCLFSEEDLFDDEDYDEDDFDYDSESDFDYDCDSYYDSEIESLD